LSVITASTAGSPAQRTSDRALEDRGGGLAAIEGWIST
jgi:hypothetical protein